MKVSQLRAFLFLAILFVLAMIFTPVVAGEHPWDEDKNGGGGHDSTGATPTNESRFEDGGDNHSMGALMGSTFFWWEFLIESTHDAKSGRFEYAPKPVNSNGSNNQKGMAH